MTADVSNEPGQDNAKQNVEGSVTESADKEEILRVEGLLHNCRENDEETVEEGDDSHIDRSVRCEEDTHIRTIRRPIH